MATTRDIAKYLGISRETVSRALNNRPGIHPDTRKKVIDAAKKLNYIPNRAARALVNNTNHLVAICVFSGSEYQCNSLGYGINHAYDDLKHFGFEVKFVANDSFDIVEQKNQINKLVDDGVEAIAIAHYDPNMLRDSIAKLVSKGIPVLLFSYDMEDGQHLCYVGGDYYKSGRLLGKILVNYMNKKGNIAIASPKSSSSNILRRLKGFKEITDNYNDISVKLFEFDQSSDKAFNSICKMLDANTDIDYIFALNNRILDLVAKAVDDKGLKQKIGIMGYGMSPSTERYIRDSVVECVVHNEPEIQGNFIVKILYNLVIDNIEPSEKRLYTKLEVITSENLDCYVNAGSRMEILNVNSIKYSSKKKINGLSYLQSGELKMEPKQNKKLQRMPLGKIKPEGWLRNQLLIQRHGLTGHIDEIWEDLGSNSGWLGGTGEKWERGPYYCDGLVPLAYLLNDKPLIKKAEKWVNWALDSAQENGFFGPADNADWWPRFVMMKVLIQYCEATDDSRIVELMSKYFKYRLKMCREKPLTDWGRARGADEIYSILWLYDRIKEDYLLELAGIVVSQSIDWSDIFNDFPYEKQTASYMDWDRIVKKEYTLEEKQQQPYFETHIVNVAMGIKHPAIRQQLYGEDNCSILKNGIEALKKFHGVANGMFTGDEHLNGTAPTQGIELCAVAEYMFSLACCIETYGDVELCDLLEKITFNALPATISPDFTAHQYDQQLNQVACTVEKRDWYNNEPDSNIFGLEPNFGCCTANMHQAWPKYTQHLWMEKDDNKGKALYAISYAPCSISYEKMAIKVDTEYPFKDYVYISAMGEGSVDIYLRIPKWCTRPSISRNGESVEVKPNTDFIKIEKFTSSDYIELTLDADIRVSTWHNDSIAIERGALLYSLPIGFEKKIIVDRGRFSDYELRPTTEWNYAIDIDSMSTEDIKTTRVTPKPFDSQHPPIKLKAKGYMVDDWGIEHGSAGDVPNGVIIDGKAPVALELVPYGCTQLRISQFPKVNK